MRPPSSPPSHQNCVGPEVSVERASSCRRHHRRPRQGQSSAAAKANQVRERGRAASRPALGAPGQPGCRGRSACRTRCRTGPPASTGWRRPPHSSLGRHIRSAWRPKGIHSPTDSRCKPSSPVHYRHSRSRCAEVLPHLRHVARPEQLSYVRQQTAHPVGSCRSRPVLNGAAPRAAVGMEPRPFGRPTPGPRGYCRGPR